MIDQSLATRSSQRLHRLRDDPRHLVPERDPGFADLDPETLCLDPVSVEAKITSRTRGSWPCISSAAWPISTLKAIGDRHGIPVIEDCAQAQLAEIDGRLAGTIGQIGCFSFNNTKHLNCGEGGMVITNDDALARRAPARADKAWPRDEDERYSLFLGQNYRLNELEAAVALVGLRRLDDNVAARRKAVESVYERIAGVPGIEVRIIAECAVELLDLHLFVDDGIDPGAVSSARGRRASLLGKVCHSALHLACAARCEHLRSLSVPIRFSLLRPGVRLRARALLIFEKRREQLILLSVDEQWTDDDADDVAAAIRKVLPRFATGV
ncbi:MAG: DegT/DnrJ/EryC1/StrS family aminotransferase [Thermomicrobiales bacterium]